MNSSSTGKDRLLFADNLRGFLILLVVLGHCIQFSYTDFAHNIVFRYIYSFHMPLFMFLSGFVSYRGAYRLESIGRRFSQLVVPFICWAALEMAMGGDFNLLWLREPDRALWFLWVLFWISVQHIAISKLSAKLNIAEEILMLASICFFMTLLFRGRTAYGVGLIAWYLPFYCAGALSRKYFDALQPVLLRMWLPLLCSFLVLGWFWMGEDSPTFLTTNSESIAFGYKLITGMAGSFCFLSIAMKWNHRVLYLTELGGMTLGIYAVHQPILHFLTDRHILDSNPIIQPVVLFIATLLLSIGLYFLLNRAGILRKLFLGK